MDGITQKILLTFVAHMSKELEREFREVNQDYYISIMNMFQGSYNEYARDVAMNMGEELKFLLEWRNRPPVGRFYWPSTRKFIFKQIMKYRAMNKKGIETEKKRPAPLQLSIDEMKRVEHARKAVSQAMTQYQKAIASAKTLGLLDAKPKSAKQEKDGKLKVNGAAVAVGTNQVTQSGPIIISSVNEDDVPK